ncbi:hypothetical protein GWK47_003900 [Chionoecetes opilio]|uniref:Uncharacterized protein n=1 Tax=Chionoecetes opilio TaxID=41210 RepID=A0A8J4YJN9_CHIOP|nr:hypothetical protein GWK47_003900 [Chionoecetes opilio]
MLGVSPRRSRNLRNGIQVVQNPESGWNPGIQHPIMGNGTLAVPRMECGFLLCNASTVTTDDSKHYWDYYVEWEMPREVQDDTAVFQMGNEYQMPHSYLVFRSFKSNFTGRYRCHLHFRGTRVGSHTVYLTLHKSLSSRNCYH